MSLSKMIMGQSGNQGTGGGLDVDDVFNTFVADATGSGSLTVNNGIDLSGEGGIVWNKSRNGTANHFILDPNIGSGGYLEPNNTASLGTGANYSFTSTGLTDAYNNYSGNEAVWWTFRKAPKFFDTVTYTGDQVVGRTVSHNLGSTPGMIIIKKLDSLEDWSVWHKDFNVNGSGLTTQFLKLNSNSGNTNTGSGASAVEDVRSATSTTFTIGNDNRVNLNNASYVAYLFAHNNNDGEFGGAGDQDIIKCGSYSTNSSAKASINLGFEPQWIIYRPVNDTTDFKIIDNIRGFMGSTPASGFFNRAVSANQNFNEYDEDGIHLTPTGFEHVSGFASKDFIFMAIRRGPLAAPTDATKVFAIDTNIGTSTGTNEPFAGFVTDLVIAGNRTSGGKRALSRLTGHKYMWTYATAPEGTIPSAEFGWDSMTGWTHQQLHGSPNVWWQWARAPSFCEVVTYNGNGTSGRTINHNLGVVPEMIWIKNRGYDDGGGNGEGWFVYHKGLNGGTDPEDYGLRLDTSAAQTNGHLNDTAPTSTVFTVGNDRIVNALLEASINNTYIAYLFATVAGVSKVGSASHTNGSATNVDCGFTNGARFILLKRYNDTGNWVVFDSTRGIVAGNDPYSLLDKTDAEDSYGASDAIDPLSSGFTITGNFFTTGDYIFYAIA